jgi:hypothetical protein
MDKNIIQKKGKYFTESERHELILEYLSTGCTKQEIWQKYTGEGEEHGMLLRWMRQLGYDVKVKIRRPSIVSDLYAMSSKNKTGKLIDSDDESFENLQLKKRIAELEKQLKDAELKAIAFSTMVDIAEKEFKIPIRKKFNTKP